MTYQINDTKIPGTIVNVKDAGATGEEFLDRIFFTTDGILLSQLRNISGIDGSTLQNWVKRGWIGNTVNKRYSKNQLAHILIVNMLRDTMRFERIDFLLRYINGTINDESDDIIPESRLFGYICRILERMSDANGLTADSIQKYIRDEICDYVEKMPGAYQRLENALSIIVTAYCASRIKAESSKLFDEIRNVDE